MTSSADIDRLEARIAVLEKAAAPAGTLEQTLFDTLQKTLHAITALDQRVTNYRTADHLAEMSRLYAKSKSIVVVGRGYFGGNVKYAFLYLNQLAKKQGIACTFLTYNVREYDQLKAAGLPCLLGSQSEWTNEQIKTLLKASVVVLGDFFFPINHRLYLPYALLQGAKTVQLWHGIPLKEIALENINSTTLQKSGTAEILASSGPFDVLVASSAALRHDWGQRFAFREFAPIGYPCTDLFFRDVELHDMINVDAALFDDVQKAASEAQPVILYTPTFRDHEGAAWFEKASLTTLADHCRAQGYVFCVNLHPAEHDAIDEFRKRYPGIRFVDPHTDIYPIAKYADVLITDYSSLVFEYLLLDRPIVFYRPDHQDYIARSRGLIEQHEAYKPGDEATTIEGLIKAVDGAVAGSRDPKQDAYREARHILSRKLFDYYDGAASERLSTLILEQMERP